MLFQAVPAITAHWTTLLIVISIITILYGNLCAIPQRNLKRLLGYSSIANAGYLLMGVATDETAQGGQRRCHPFIISAGYLFTRARGAFIVICLVMRKVESEDISGAGGIKRTFAAARRHVDPGHGVACRHSPAGRVLRKISPAQGRRRTGGGRIPRVLLAGGARPFWACLGSPLYYYFRRDSDHLLVTA